MDGNVSPLKLMRLSHFHPETTFSSAKLCHLDARHRPVQSSLAPSKIHIFLCLAAEALFGPALGSLSPFQVNLFRVLSSVSQYRHPVGLNLHETTTNCEALFFVSTLQPQFTRG
jgi:hypothetical protein